MILSYNMAYASTVYACMSKFAFLWSNKNRVDIWERPLHHVKVVLTLLVLKKKNTSFLIFKALNRFAK